MNNKLINGIMIMLGLLLAAACGPAVAETSFTTESGLQYEQLEAGDGESPETGDLVSVHYIGRLEDGTEFDNSYERGQPFQFQLGVGEVIPGWDEGIALMRVGEKATLTIPPDLAYGSAGAGGVIPPDATLIFETELVAVDDPPPTPTPLPPPTSVDDAEFITTESGLQYAVLEEGNGQRAQIGDIVTLEFAGWVEGGESIGSTASIGQPFQFMLGEEEILPGWDEMVLLLEVGGRTQFKLPPELGLGEQGSGDIIPPNSTLIFEMELLDVSDPPPPPTPGPPPTSVEESEFTETESGLRYAILEEGDGESPVAGQTVVVHYRGWLEDGTQFDNSYDRGQPFEFVLGQGMVIAGWDEGLALLQVGDKAQLVIPSDLAYGEQGGGSVIPPGATLIFEVELLEIRE